MSALAWQTRKDAEPGAVAGLDARVVVRRGGFALDAVLRVPGGSVVALMGPSGAGKSTLLGVLAGLTGFDQGHVRLGDRTLDESPVRRTPPASRGVVLLGQDPRLFPHLSARDNVAFGLRVHGAAKAAAADGAADWLRRVGLEGLGGRRPAQLSGGQQQRVALARALATAPAAILLDEPLTSLDTETAGDVRALLHQQLAATGTTAVVATHDAVDAVALASRLVVLEGGRVTQSGPVREVLASPATRFAAAVAGLNRVEGRAVPAAPPLTPGASSGASGRVGPAAAWRAGNLVLPLPAGVRHPSLAAVFRPSDVRVVDGAPSGAGEWTAHIVRLEQTPAGVRVRTADPDVAVDVTADRAAGLAPGDPITLRVDPADVRFVVEA
ncbi:sulfate/molybdate ABC transporter ATP-binding protein [Microbacterium trichothecenolyticum]|uniref:Sulfate/thiosulfate import ATP-binding protein CysA n=1 Tax=Microbacterium trichothecenolyticum TaxID=69370 RepID=A0A0M2HBD4_MICTR|nr:ABC transporter ATP-binding protein [Microbacterium trichothecenolyticum]KJL41507.1 Sulfate/thiosulfate import ATP-binding protein CysA [Microbacterium trichothecenolyticum]